VCYLRGDYRSGHFGESEIDEVGPGAKHEKQEKMRRLMWARLLLPKNMIWSSALFVTGKLPKNPHGFDVCKECGGFGFVKRTGRRYEYLADKRKRERKPTMKEGTSLRIS